jgi:hypothetical protein
MRQSWSYWADSQSQTFWTRPMHPQTLDWYFRDLLEPDAMRPEDV